MTQHISRKTVVIHTVDAAAGNQIRKGDFLEVEIDLPVLQGFPQRYMYCRCRVSEVRLGSTGVHICLDLDTIQFRGSETLFDKQSSATKLLM